MATEVIKSDGKYYVEIDIGSTPEEIIAARGDYPDNMMGGQFRPRNLFAKADALVLGTPDFNNTGEFLQALSSFEDMAPCATRQVFSARKMDDGSTKYYPPVAVENELTATPGHPCNMAHIEYQRAAGGDISAARDLFLVRTNDAGQIIQKTYYNNKAEWRVKKTKADGSPYYRPLSGDEVRPLLTWVEDQAKRDEIVDRCQARRDAWDAYPADMGPTPEELEVARDNIRDFAARITYWISRTGS